jgi:fatty-acyl-CoA synthase
MPATTPPEDTVEVPLLVNDFLRRAAKLYPNKTAIVDGDDRFTYGQFQERVNQLGHALLSLGIQKGDRVCILSPNSHYFMESYYAVTQIGAILVPLNYRLVAADHEYIINHAGVKAVLVDYEYTKVVDDIRPNMPNVQHWIVADPRPTSQAPDGWTDWDRLVGNQPTTATPFVEQDENDTTSINYTSGTTARPKGVMLTHRNCYINAYNFIAHLRIRHEDVELWTLPMFHANGWGGPFALTAMGATHVVLRAVVAEDIYRLIQDEKVTFACMAPAVLSTVLNYPDRSKYNITTRPRFTVAGAPPPAAFIERLEKEIGWEFIEIYGLTETAPILTVSTPDYQNPDGTDYARRSRAGVEAIGVDIQVLDDNGQPVPKDGVAIGEVCARSNVVLKGYWEQPEETAKAIYDGYFHSGDLAVWDEFSNIHIVDRKKDVIISGGENISSPEIEDALYKHPAVLECAVIGVPSEKWGETPKALVILREGQSPTEEEIIAFTRQHLAHFKCPTSVDFVETLPRTVTGKLQKFVIREQYWKGAERRVN